MLTHAAPSRRFSMGDQTAFAALSGDFNPMHLDAAAARRTPAGEPVVHGMAGLLWALEQLAQKFDLSQLRQVKADFAQFIYLGETVELNILKQTPTAMQIELRAAGAKLSNAALAFGPREHRAARLEAGTSGPAIIYGADATAPLALPFPALAVCHGQVAIAPHAAATLAAYPALGRAIGAARIAGFLALTRLVGMVAPGLHSVFHRVAIDLVEHDAPPGGLLFAAGAADARFNLLTLQTVAAGIAGTVKASMRQPPVAQPGMAALQPLVAPTAFAGQRALIIGGSRGLGAFTAKFLACGGATPIITYATGAAEAQAVAAEIAAHGGHAETAHYDVTRPAGPQLAALPRDIGAMYYFATPRISRRPVAKFSPDLFASFCQAYIGAFQDLVETLLARGGPRLCVFYPSSIAIEDRPANMTEYAMAKAAGEVLCADLARFNPKLMIESVRLPRLPTDQTASMMQLEVHATVDVMPPIIRRVQAA